MLKYLRKYWFCCLLAPLFMLGETSMDLIQPDMMADIVDNGVLVRDMSVILRVGMKMIFLVLFGCFSGIMSGVFANFASQRFANDLRKDLFHRIMNLSFEQTDKISTGSLVTRLTNDVTQVQTMVSMSVRAVFRCSSMFLGGIVMLYLQSPKFALIAACGLPFIIGLVTFFIRKASPLFSVVQQKLDGINNVMQEDVAGARVVKAYVKEAYELDRFDRANDELCRTNLRVQSLLSFMHPCMNIVLNLCIVFILFISGKMVTIGGLTPGNTMAAITYMTQILHSIMFMANIFQIFTRAKASSARILEVLESPEIIKDGTLSRLPDAKGEIIFQNVSFAYPDAPDRMVLENLSFTIRQGETLAIIGSTGSGKSSLVHLIPRFYDVTEGEILVDGVNVKDYPLQKLREKIAIVLQKAELYSRPIEANIRWGKDNATPWEIKDAAEIAQADEFIVNTPYGYYTQVTESGHSLSGGQKQRISISRAILKNAEILIFDDSTSALDLKTEEQLYKALRTASPDATKIIIAQRISSVKNADRIIVLEQGKISACDTHENLLKYSEIYQDIYHSQLKAGDALL